MFTCTNEYLADRNKNDQLDICAGMRGSRTSLVVGISEGAGKQDFPASMFRLYFSRFVCPVFFLFSALFIQSCTSERELLSALEQKQALEVLSVFDAVGVRSSLREYGSGQRARFKIVVASSDYSKALSVLQEYDLPSKNEDEFLVLTARQGIVPNTLGMDKLKQQRAQASQLEELLSVLPGVLRCRVVLSEELTKKVVSVAIKSGFDFSPDSLNEELVKKIVSRAVAGLSESDISVSISPPSLRNSSILCGAGVGSVLPLRNISFGLFSVSVPENQYDAFRANLASLFGFVSFIALFLGGLIAHIFYRLRR